MTFGVLGTLAFLFACGWDCVAFRFYRSFVQFVLQERIPRIYRFYENIKVLKWAVGSEVI